MPTYKAIPVSKKSEHLPLYRPMDRWVGELWEKKDRLTPFIIVFVIALVAFAGFKSYSVRYESKASGLLNQGKLEEATREYPRSKSARLARMKLGKQALDTAVSSKDAKFYDKAIQWYEPLVTSTSTPALLKVAASQNLALAYLKTGDAAKAVEVLKKIAEDPANLTADYTRLLLARSQEVQGNVEEAKVLYQSLSEAATEVSIKDEAKERLTWIDKTEKSENGKTAPE